MGPLHEITVIVADDHELVRRGFMSMITAMEGIRCIGEASNGKQVLELLRSGSIADVVLLDVEMPQMGGLETAGFIAKNYLSVKTVMLTMLTDPELVQEAMDAGAKGFLFKNSPAAELETAIRRVVAGGNFLSSEVASLLMKKKADTGNNAVDQLSARELEIIRSVAEGLSSQEIGKQLFISPRTVDTHRNNILQKLDLPNIAALVSFAYRNKLIR